MTTAPKPQPRTDAVIEGVRMDGSMVAYRERQLRAMEAYAGDQEREIDRLRSVNAELVAALEDVELRCTQARLASKIGKKRDSSEFLCGEVERIAVQARAALARAKE